jgi:hypothetical protein
LLYARLPRPEARPVVERHAPLGQADAVFVRDGGRHAGRAHGSGERDLGAAQPRRRGWPALAGALLDTGHAALPLVLCGVLKIADLALLAMFRGVKPPEER